MLSPAPDPERDDVSRMVFSCLDKKQTAVTSSYPCFIDGLDPAGQPFLEGRNPHMTRVPRRPALVMKS